MRRATPPDLPLVVGLDGGYVHSSTRRTRRDGWFEVIAGKAMPATGKSSCFGYVQTYDKKSKRRLFDVLTSHRMQANQQVTFLTDGGDDFGGYLTANAGSIPNYGERRRAGETISTSFVESTVNQVISKHGQKTADALKPPRSAPAPPDTHPDPQRHPHQRLPALLTQLHPHPRSTPPGRITSHGFSHSRRVPRCRPDAGAGRHVPVRGTGLVTGRPGRPPSAGGQGQHVEHQVEGMLSSAPQIRDALDTLAGFGADEVMFYCWSHDVDQVERIADAVA